MITRKIFLPLLVSGSFMAATAMAYDAEDYKSKCGFSMAIPKGSAAKVEEKTDAEGLCKVELEVDGVEFYAASRRGNKTTLEELSTWVAEETEIPADKWSEFDKGDKHVGYKATKDSDNVWAATEKGKEHDCVGIVYADKGEDEKSLQQFYDSLKCL